MDADEVFAGHKEFDPIGDWARARGHGPEVIARMGQEPAVMGLPIFRPGWKQAALDFLDEQWAAISPK